MKVLLTLILSLAFLQSNGQQFSKNWKDLNYAGDTTVSHRLDIYLPLSEQSSYPVVMAICGSAWFGNNTKDEAFRIMAKPLLDAGFAVVTVNHRSSRQAIFPAQINDIKAAVRFVRANAEKYQLNPSFIGITGFSSGGHLSALAGTSGAVGKHTVKTAEADLEGNIGSYTKYSSSVDAVVDFFGPTNFLLMDSCAGGSSSHNAADSPESTLIGGPIQNHPDKCALADPITYVDAGDPHFLIIHGDNDPLVPHCQSEVLFIALQKAGVGSRFVTVPGGGHGPGVFEEKYFKMMTDFFLKESADKIARY
jgi:acetyl esterase/lipase